MCLIKLRCSVFLLTSKFTCSNSCGRQSKCPEKIIVTASPSQDPQAPVSGFVATKRYQQIKHREIEKHHNPLVITRDQMDAQDVSSVSPLLYARVSQNIVKFNRNDEVLFDGYSYAPVFLMACYGMGASSSTGT